MLITAPGILTHEEFEKEPWMQNIHKLILNDIP
jgi:hypothetical protein